MAVVSVTFVALLGTLSTPASAHDVHAVGPFGCGFPPASCGFGQVRDQHEIIDACDTKADGKTLRVKYELRNGSFGQVDDPNGATAGCGIVRVGATSRIAKIAVCSNGVVGTGSTWLCNQWVDA
jgi:hypothetical protein